MCADAGHHTRCACLGPLLVNPVIWLQISVGKLQVRVGVAFKAHLSSWVSVFLCMHSRICVRIIVYGKSDVTPVVQVRACLRTHACVFCSRMLHGTIKHVSPPCTQNKHKAGLAVTSKRNIVSVTHLCDLQCMSSSVDDRISRNDADDLAAREVAAAQLKRQTKLVQRTRFLQRRLV
jgi:hypothetical protein